MSAAARKARPDDGFVRPEMPTLESLDSEHRDVMITLSVMKDLIDLLDRDGITPRARELARQVCEFFNHHARAHHAAEERMIFPALLKSDDAELKRHVARLQQDHGWLEEDWLELEPQLEAVVNGFSWYDIDLLRHALPVFEQLYREHIALEESLIYPEARRRRDLADSAARQRRGPTPPGSADPSAC